MAGEPADPHPIEFDYNRVTPRIEPESQEHLVQWHPGGGALGRLHPERGWRTPNRQLSATMTDCGGSRIVESRHQNFPTRRCNGSIPQRPSTRNER